jgi:hypothetical protein
MGWIPSSIEKAEAKLRAERNEIEAALFAQEKRFQAKIDETKVAVMAFKENNIQRKAATYVAEIDEINKTIKYLTGEMKAINGQQDLEMEEKDWPIILELKDYIKPFEELWRMTVEFTEKYKAWESNNLSTLSPSEIEDDYKKFYSGTNKLAAKFE